MRNYCNTLRTSHNTSGREQTISTLLEGGAHSVEIWGNSADGFEPYLVSDTQIGISISSDGLPCVVMRLPLANALSGKSSNTSRGGIGYD